MRLGLRRLRRERRRRAGARGDRLRRAEAAQLRHLRRAGARRRAARAAARSTSSSSGSSDASPTSCSTLAHGEERAVLFTVHRGRRELGSKRARAARSWRGDRRRPARARGARARTYAATASSSTEGPRVFAEVFGPPPRLVVVGAVDTGEALCAAAKAVGWHTICVDARAQYATPRADAERRRAASSSGPTRRSRGSAPDRDTAVVVLTHDEKFDIPALAAALRTDAFYVGALGSRRAQEKRRERLRRGRA